MYNLNISCLLYFCLLDFYKFKEIIAGVGLVPKVAILGSSTRESFYYSVKKVSIIYKPK